METKPHSDDDGWMMYFYYILPRYYRVLPTPSQPFVSLFSGTEVRCNIYKIPKKITLSRVYRCTLVQCVHWTSVQCRLQSKDLLANFLYLCTCLHHSNKPTVLSIFGWSLSKITSHSYSLSANFHVTKFPPLKFSSYKTTEEKLLRSYIWCLPVQNRK